MSVNMFVLDILHVGPSLQLKRKEQELKWQNREWLGLKWSGGRCRRLDGGEELWMAKMGLEWIGGPSGGGGAASGGRWRPGGCERRPAGGAKWCGGARRG